MAFDTKVDHINIIVTDLAAGVAAWEALLGHKAHPQEVHESLGYTSADIILPDGNNISLLEPYQPDTNDMGKTVKGHIDRKGEGLYILALGVDDPNGIADELAAQELRMIPLQGMAFVHPKSSNGVSVEYIKPGYNKKGTSEQNGSSWRAVGLNHVGIAVNDLADASGRWSKILGGVEVKSTGDHPDLGYKGAFAHLSNGGVDLIEPLVKDESNNTQRMINQKGEGMILLALDVVGVSECAKALNEQGWRVNDMGGGIAFVSPKSTRGVMVELIEKS